VLDFLHDMATEELDGIRRCATGWRGIAGEPMPPEGWGENNAATAGGTAIGGARSVLPVAVALDEQQASQVLPTRLAEIAQRGRAWYAALTAHSHEYAPAASPGLPASHPYQSTSDSRFADWLARR
jgi:hypothetical protein